MADAARRPGRRRLRDRSRYAACSSGPYRVGLLHAEWTLSFWLAELHEGQKHLRTERFFAEKASYTAFLLPHEAKDAYVFCCGDCTLGAQSPDGNIEWLTRTHTLVTALEELGISADASKQHIVTRTLNAKRFQKPEVHVVPANVSGLWVLATDGYRYRESDDTGHPKDDCSALLIGSGLEAKPAIDHTNLFVRTSQNYSFSSK